MSDNDSKRTAAAPPPPRDGEVCPNCHGSRRAMCGLPCDTCLDTGTRAGYERWKGVVPAAPSEPPAEAQASQTANHMTAHVVVVSHADQILEVWTENDYGLLSRDHATELADWANAQPGNDRLHQAVAVTALTSARMGR